MAVAGADNRAALDVVKQLKAANGLAWHVAQNAKASSDHGTVLRALDRIQKHMELQAKLLGDLDDRPQVTANVLVASPEHIRARTAIMEALRPFPEARVAVAAALAALSEPS